MKINSDRFKQHCIEEVEILRKQLKEQAAKGNYSDAMETRAYKDTWEFILESWEEPEERDYMEADDGWNDPKLLLPADDHQVMCIVEGIVSNTNYDDAFMTGYYFNDEDSWGFDAIHFRDSWRLKVKAWREIPSAPRWVSNVE